MAGKPNPKQQTSARYDQRRQEVLVAAARTFNRMGFHIATLDDVAAELGVTKPALYYYAKSKDELLFACGQMALDALDGALDKSDGTDLNGLQRLSRFFRLYAEIICEDFGRCLVLTEPRDLATRSRKANVSGRRALNLAVRDIIKDGIKDGSIKPCDERTLAIAMFDAFNGLGRWFDAKGDLSLATVVDQYLGIFAAGIAATGSKSNA
jgi:AcrR family transcriptional regulator